MKLDNAGLLSTSAEVVRGLCLWIGSVFSNEISHATAVLAFRVANKTQATQDPEVAEHIAEGGVLVVSGSSCTQLGGRNLMKVAAIVGLTREAAGDKTFDLTMSSFDRPATWSMGSRLTPSRSLCRPTLESGKIQ